MLAKLKIIFVIALVSGLAAYADRISSAISLAKSHFRVHGTIQDRLLQHGAAAKERWLPHFERVGMSYPPDRLVLVGLKAEKRLEVYGVQKGKTALLRSFPILAASGDLGPKLREGDGQVPEGIYPVDSLNPNSAFHLSLRVGYPSAADRAQAARDRRTKLGGDIMIHGNSVSIGCIAIGDRAAEDLFVLAALTGREKVKVVLSPVDFRVTGLPKPYAEKVPSWVADRYELIKNELRTL